MSQSKDRELKRTYGLTIEEYNLLLRLQNYVCAICRRSEVARTSTKHRTRTLAVDHCHLTQKIRGLLCHKCNTGIGNFNDSAQLLQAAIQYLGK